MMEKLVPGPYIKIKTRRISRSTVWNVIKFAFIVCSSGGLPKHIKGALSGLRQVFATEIPLKMVKNAFCFASKALLAQELLRWNKKYFSSFLKGFQSS